MEGYVLGLRIYGKFTYQILSISYGFLRGMHNTSDNFVSQLPTSRVKVYRISVIQGSTGWKGGGKGFTEEESKVEKAMDAAALARWQRKEAERLKQERERARNSNGSKDNGSNTNSSTNSKEKYTSAELAAIRASMERPGTLNLKEKTE
jgi:hypothetical protein